MLQKGIIETIEDMYTAKVRIPRYNKIAADASGTSKEDLAVAVVCTLPGMKVAYSVGDVVLVDFENDELNKPVILGLLYREKESNSFLKLTGIDETLDTVNSKLSQLESLSLYTHIKYSNDNGMTFTSLYDPETTIQNDDYTVSPSANIPIDNQINVIYWSIIDDNNVDITESIPIQTTIQGSNPAKDIEVKNTYSTSLIKPPLELQLCTTASITYTIPLSKAEASKYYIALTTDKNKIGSVYGDYLGIATTNDAEPSTNTKDYTWTSVVSRSGQSLAKTTDSLLERIQNNERDLRGYTEDDPSNDSELGLLEAINISLDNIIIGLNKANILFGDRNQYINVSSSNFHINTVTQKEFEFSRIEKPTISGGTSPDFTYETVPHLVLAYIEEE